MSTMISDGAALRITIERDITQRASVTGGDRPVTWTNSFYTIHSPNKHVSCTSTPTLNGSQVIVENWLDSC